MTPGLQQDEQCTRDPKDFLPAQVCKVRREQGEQKLPAILKREEGTGLGLHVSEITLPTFYHSIGGKETGGKGH